MTDPLGPILASGRAADVYDQGDGTVLRRYRTERDAGPEGRAMMWLRQQGVQVPKVHRAEGTDLLMERIPGPTMLEDLQSRPWKLVGHARTLASLQRELNSLSAPDWLPRHPLVPHGAVVVHLDLHPMNVICGPSGPIIIDWTNVAGGPAAFDAAMTYLLMSSVLAVGMRDRVGRRILVQAFARSRGRSLIQEELGNACKYRLADRNVTAAERGAVERIHQRTRS